MNSPDYIAPEQLLSILFKSPNATAVYTGRDITIISANEAMLKFWGKDRNVIGKNMIDVLPELSGQPFIDILIQVWDSGESYTAKDYPAIIEVGGVLQNFYFDFEYKAVLHENGQTAYILHTAFEVSERMEARKMIKEQSKAEQQLTKDLVDLNEEHIAANEELLNINAKLETVNKELVYFKNQLQEVNNTLIESENRFRSLVEHSPVAMASLKGEDFYVDVVNGSILEIWGKDRSVVGLPLHLAIPEIEKQQFLGILKEVYHSGKTFYGQELKAKLSVDGKLTDRYLNFVYKPISGKDGKTDVILIVATDVTDQVNARETVNEFNTRLQIALDASSLGSTEVDLATGTMQSTDRFKHNFGFSAEEDFAYADLFEAMLPEHRERVRGLVQEAIKTNGIYKTEYPVKWRDGSLHWIQAHGRPRYDENGNADRMVGMTADITEKKLFEQRKDDFLSIASHELKTPITSLKASLQLLDRMKNKPFSEAHIRLIEQSGKSVEKMVVLIDELLNMSRMSEDQLKLEKTRFNLHDMLSMSCNHVRMEGKYDLIIQGDKNLDLYADEHRIDQVVINFVNNAVKYAPHSHQIHIIIESLEDQVKVSVRDFGNGIDAKILPHLFDRYFRVDHSGKAYSGLGLGLYICSEIIRKHGGKIGAESTIGEGSTFWFTLPASNFKN
ncbi:PAS domain S-box-containing protein [Chryseobacterium sp. H1D6B]|uniref:PAS domain-containing sensor histidine kinase n=1 Tax=Chryseobacterium sp. H1D6B TaxID=2940588 RepID=UPI0015CEA884|nr:ATP-binding protein [Chryseobacterium sp. H1D6B]MDH6253438.1 PAS domain S-box-containing protein [Chryseobacterium sp. H1D6B]